MNEHTSIAFFGKITASISHEAKNSLAIINENIGLIEDLIFMSEKTNTPLSSERIKTITEKITMQINRSNKIFQNMNTFAHTSDKEINQEDLNEIISQLIVLLFRITNIKLIHNQKDKKIPITTSSIMLQALIHLTIDFMIEQKSGDIEISAEKTTNGANIVFKSTENIIIKNFPRDKEKALINSLNGIFEVKTSAIIIKLT